MTLGQKLKKLRTEKELSQKDLADQLHVAFQTVSKWENDENEPDIATLKELSKLYGCSVDYLISEDEQQVEEPKQEVVETTPVVAPVEQVTKTIIIHQNELRTAVRVCSYNSEHIETETVDSVYTKQNPTCKAEGSETYTASFGNPAFETQQHVDILPIDPDAHDFMVFTTPADKYTEGGTLHTCTLCGYNYTTDITSTEACFTYLYDDSLPGYEITGYSPLYFLFLKMFCKVLKCQ